MRAGACENCARSLGLGAHGEQEEARPSIRLPSRFSRKASPWRDRGRSPGEGDGRFSAAPFPLPRSLQISAGSISKTPVKKTFGGKRKLQGWRATMETDLNTGCSGEIPGAQPDIACGDQTLAQKGGVQR